MTTVINKAEFGLENLHFALFNEADGSYETPVRIKGAVTLKIKSKTNDLELWADNGVYFSLINNNGYDGDLEIYNFDDDFKAKYLGFKKDANGVLVEPAIIPQNSFALLFKTLGDKVDRVSVLYNTIFGKPDIELKTIEDKVDVEVIKIPVKATPVEFSSFDGKVVQASTTDSNKKTTWFTKVYKPSKTEGVTE